MIHEEICTYEVAKLAKKKGFNVPTRTVKVEKIEGTEKEVWDEEECRYITQWETRSVRIPTQSLLQRWLREEKKVEVYVRHFEETNKYPHHFGVIITDNKGETLEIGGKMFDSYELALEDALKYALENLV